MSSADRPGSIFAFASWMRTWPRRYGFALIAVCTAIAAQRGLEVGIGFAHSFLLFYPTILLVSLLAGFVPGVMATLLSACTAAYFYSLPSHLFVVSDEIEIVGLALFVIVGISISWLADSLRQRADRLQEFEKAVEGVEEMIVVIDRDYRYLIANRAYLNFRGVNRDDVIGHCAFDLPTGKEFEMTVRSKLEQCLRGEIVQDEMSYEDRTGGERELSVTYFPIEGSKGVDRVACILQDVTERRTAGRSLRLFRALIDHSNDAVEVVDPETLRFLDVNEKACQDLGYTREELLGFTVLRQIELRGSSFGLAGE